MFGTTKRRINSNKRSRGYYNKVMDISFAGSTESILKEMPLGELEDALNGIEGNGEEDDEEGFEVYGDNDDVYV